MYPRQARPLELLELRLRMVELAMSAVQLELQALGGRVYLRAESQGFTRRWREAAFLAVVTPTQLKMEFAKSKAGQGCESTVR